MFNRQRCDAPALRAGQIRIAAGLTQHAKGVDFCLRQPAQQPQKGGFIGSALRKGSKGKGAESAEHIVCSIVKMRCLTDVRPYSHISFPAEASVRAARYFCATTLFTLV